MKKLLFAAVVPFVPMLVQAQATAIDIADATAQLDTIQTTVLAVGGALLVAAAVAVAVKWAKASIFG